jgi:hypothetical protein
MTSTTERYVTAPPRRVRAAQDKQEVAERLLESSERWSYEPEVDVDWDSPLDPSMPALPLHRVSLYGTAMWEEMPHEQRVALSWHEFASLTSVGLWFEMCLMQGLLRYAYDQDPHRPHVQYALTEIGDETRHSVMFARTAELLAPGARYRPYPLIHQLGRLWKTVTAGPAMFASVLVAEETLDQLQREMMRDTSLLPLARRVSRIHVVEEARHVSYAREAVLRKVPKHSRAVLEWHRVLTAVTAVAVIESFVDPAVYDAVGLDRRAAAAAARANPHTAETRLWMAEKVTAFLRDAGLIAGPSTAVWRRASLIA